jgi:hypothetical protein
MLELADQAKMLELADQAKMLELADQAKIAPRIVSGPQPAELQAD